MMHNIWLTHELTPVNDVRIHASLSVFIILFYQRLSQCLVACSLLNHNLSQYWLGARFRSLLFWSQCVTYLSCGLYCVCYVFIVLSSWLISVTSQKRHGVWDQRQLDYFFNSLFRLTGNVINFNMTLPLWGKSPVTICEENRQVTGEYTLTKSQQCGKHFQVTSSHVTVV